MDSRKLLPTPLSLPRRRLLGVGLSGATLFAPVPWASVWAQGSQGSQLLRLPKIALVVGNAAYRQAPLKNSTNDAKGMAQALASVGFEVTLRLDAGQAAMQTALNTYLAQLASRKCVGLFYFAGHGVQINWKNYLIPADAQINSNQDVEARAVDVTKIVDGLNKAGNAMNLIILDACRDAPFGEAARPQQKGLSQMDAPRNTLLAYATAPGNVASDGTGANGLYTENLLREIKAPEAKIEDVFKRVRLSVRRNSHGEQIPWESTSLEDDFYFVPPASLAPPSDKEAAQRFAAELQLWEKIERAEVPEPFEDYLRRYPSGNFSELAQFRLDLALARQGEKPIVIAPQKDNPYTTGTARADTAYKVGDRYTYRVSDLDSGQPRPAITRLVTGIAADEVIYNNGQVTSDLLGNPRRTADGRTNVGAQFVPAEYAVGKSWVSRYNGKLGAGQEYYVETHLRIIAKERLTVPAGTFDCYCIEGKGVGRPFLPPSWNVQVTQRSWLAPDVCRGVIKRELKRNLYGIRNETLDNERWELESFKQG